MSEAGGGLHYPDSPADEIWHDERCCMNGAQPGWPPHPDCPGITALETQWADDERRRRGGEE